MSISEGRHRAGITQHWCVGPQHEGSWHLPAQRVKMLSPHAWRGAQHGAKTQVPAASLKLSHMRPNSCLAKSLQKWACRKISITALHGTQADGFHLGQHLSDSSAKTGGAVMFLGFSTWSRPPALLLPPHQKWELKNLEISQELIAYSHIHRPKCLHTAEARLSRPPNPGEGDWARSQTAVTFPVSLLCAEANTISLRTARCCHSLCFVWLSF